MSSHTPLRAMAFEGPRGIENQGQVGRAGFAARSRRRGEQRTISCTDRVRIEYRARSHARRLGEITPVVDLRYLEYRVIDRSRILQEAKRQHIKALSLIG